MTQLNPNWIQALTYSARLDRQAIKASFTEGVLSGMKVVQRGAGANMSVDISIGVGVIYGDDQADQGAYLVSCTVLENLAISAAPGSNARRDLIYWRINDPNAGGPAGSNSAFGKVDGTPSGSPALPSLPTSAIPLAEVLVTVGDVTVVDAKITTLRIPSYGNNDLPPGVGMPFFGPEAAIPANCVLLNGQSISKDTYWRIFYFYGTTYGSTSTNFSVPDLRGRLPVGLDNMGGSDAGRLAVANTLGGVGGEETHVITTAEMPIHTHSGSSGNPSVDHTHTFTTGTQSAPHHHTFGSGSTTTAAAGGNTVPSTITNNTSDEIGNHTHSGTTAGASANHTHVITIGNAGGDGAHNNMPPYILCNWIARN